MGKLEEAGPHQPPISVLPFKDYLGSPGEPTKQNAVDQGQIDICAEVYAPIL